MNPKFLRFLKATYILTFVLMASFVVRGLLQTQFNISNNGTTITPSMGILVCITPECDPATDNVTSISWGTFRSGTVANRGPYYLKNAGNLNITVSFPIFNQVPGDIIGIGPGDPNFHLTLTTTYVAGTILHPNDMVPLTLTLTCNNAPIGTTSFSFDLGVLGTEA